jgi:hypothetical protein
MSPPLTLPWQRDSGTMVNILTVGIGAGLVSALLIAVIVKATPLAVLLYLLAPIPILIAALGWNHRSGLIAAATGGAAMAFVLSPLSGLGFVVTTALPAWWLAYLTLLGRPGPNGALDWYPLGRLLAWIAATAAVTLVAAAIVSTGDYDAFRDNSRAIAGSLFRGPTGGPSGEDAANAQSSLREQIVESFAVLVPLFAAQGFAAILTFYVWAAAKVVALSGRLPRPWPFLPGVAMPRAVVGVLGLGVVLPMVGGFVGVFGLALVGALTTAFALQGLAAIHDRTRGKPGRAALLFGTYLLVVLSQGAVLVALTLFGLADTVFGLRRRLRAPGAGPSNPV